MVLEPRRAFYGNRCEACPWPLHQLAKLHGVLLGYLRSESSFLPIIAFIYASPNNVRFEWNIPLILLAIVPPASTVGSSSTFHHRFAARGGA